MLQKVSVFKRIDSFYQNKTSYKFTEILVMVQTIGENNPYKQNSIKN